MTANRSNPFLFEEGDPALDGPAPDPFAAAQPPDDADDAAAPGAHPAEPAAARAARLASRRASRLARWFWSAALGLLSLAVSVALHDFVAGLIARNLVLGWLALGLTAALAAAALGFALREWAGLARLGRIDALRAGAGAALAQDDLEAARATVAGLRRLYGRRHDMARGLSELEARAPERLDAETTLAEAERVLMRDLDAKAAAAVGRAARTVAAATALVPLALVDVLAALSLNLRMIREIAEIYGGRAGWLGSWRLLRAVAAHLVATGAVAIGDDLLGPALGGGVLSRLSRRFGEGLINGALTARVGAAAIDVCRPLPFSALPRPSGRGLARSALTGFMSGGR